MTNGTQSARFNTDDEDRFVNTRRSNIKSDLIEITEDKLENILLKHLARVGSRSGWVAPLSLFISVILTISSANFTDKFGIAASTWDAIFMLASVLSGIWLIFSLALVAANWKKSSTSYLIAQIKNFVE